MTSNHYMTDREYREALIKIIGQGNVIDKFVVDRGHKNGAERHELTDTGIIIIYNIRTNKLVTKLIARPNQVKRYYPNGDYPKHVVELARRHQEMGYNLY